MGGCASRPKDLNCTPATLPGENVVEPVIKDVEVETSAEEKKMGEEPLVDLSEPTKDVKAEKEESKNAIDDLLVTEISASDEKKTEVKVEAGNETKEEIKGEEPAVKDVEEKKDETPKSDAAQEEKVKSETEEKKDEAPLVST